MEDLAGADTKHVIVMKVREMKRDGVQSGSTSMTATSSTKCYIREERRLAECTCTCTCNNIVAHASCSSCRQGVTYVGTIIPIYTTSPELTSGQVHTGAI